MSQRNRSILGKIMEEKDSLLSTSLASLYVKDLIIIFIKESDLI